MIEKQGYTDKRKVQKAEIIPVEEMHSREYKPQQKDDNSRCLWNIFSKVMLPPGEITYYMPYPTGKRNYKRFKSPKGEVDQLCLWGT